MYADKANKIKIKKQSMNTFTYVLVTWRTNTNTIFQEATGENLSTFEYIWHLGKRFVVPHI